MKIKGSTDLVTNENGRYRDYEIITWLVHGI